MLRVGLEAFELVSFALVLIFGLVELRIDMSVSGSSKSKENTSGGWQHVREGHQHVEGAAGHW